MGIDTNQSLNPSSIKARFAFEFRQVMKKLNKKRPPSTSMANKYKRYRIIRAASCVSMASVVGPRRAWSRAVLKKLRSHSLNHFSMSESTFTRLSKRRSTITVCRGGNPREEMEFGQEDDLRRLVPGGEAMDFCRLLSESAHYIECLRAQVQVMTDILDSYST